MRVILYTKHFDEDIKEKVDVILSPEFYWIKKIEVSSLNEAKKIAKNIFRLEGDYLFDAIKVDNKFFAIAIDRNLNLKIDKKYINSIRVAQSELYNFDEIKVDNEHYIKKIEDILFCFPEVSNPVDFEKIKQNLKLSKYKFNLSKSSISKSQIIFFIVLFVLFNSYFIFESIAYFQTKNNLLKQKKSYLSKYNLPATTFQLDSILNELKDKVVKIEYVKKGLNIFTRSNFLYKKISYNNGTFEVEIKSKKNLDNYFKNYFNILSSSYKKGIYKARLTQ